MTKKEARKVFFSFLKKNNVYIEYMRAFILETTKPVENRYAKRSENRVVEFLDNHNYNYWILNAFSWSYDGDWIHIHNLWLEYYSNYEKEHSAIPAVDAY